MNARFKLYAYANLILCVYGEYVHLHTIIHSMNCPVESSSLQSSPVHCSPVIASHGALDPFLSSPPARPAHSCSLSLLSYEYSTYIHLALHTVQHRCRLGPARPGPPRPALCSALSHSILYSSVSRLSTRTRIRLRTVLILFLAATTVIATTYIHSDSTVPNRLVLVRVSEKNSNSEFFSYTVLRFASGMHLGYLLNAKQTNRKTIARRTCCLYKYCIVLLMNV